MRRLWLRAGVGLLAATLPVFVCGCGKQEPPRKVEHPTGVIDERDPRWKGIPEEIGDERGIMTKKIYPKDKKQPAAR
jgi:hypothetical protein